MESPEAMRRRSAVGRRQSEEAARGIQEEYKLHLYYTIAREIDARIGAAASRGETRAAMELEDLKRTRVGSGSWSSRPGAGFVLEAAELVRDEYRLAGYRADVCVDAQRDEGSVWLDGGMGASSEVERRYLMVDWS